MILSSRALYPLRPDIYPTTRSNSLLSSYSYAKDPAQRSRRVRPHNLKFWVKQEAGKATRAIGAAHPQLGIGLVARVTSTNGLVGELVEHGLLARRPRRKHGD